MEIRNVFDSMQLLTFCQNRVTIRIEGNGPVRTGMQGGQDDETYDFEWDAGYADIDFYDGGICHAGVDAVDSCADGHFGDRILPGWSGAE